ncbi:MAG: alpha/beta fold hydrolase [Pseudomonadota bacterium]
MKGLRYLLAVLTQIAGYCIGAIGFVAVFFASATLMSNPLSFIVVALIVSLSSLVLLSWLSGSIMKLQRRFHYTLSHFVAGSLLVLVFVSVFLLRPLVPKELQTTPTATDGVEYWDLPTGSRIAVRKISGEGGQPRDPVIVLHGGPGSFAVGLDLTWQSIGALSEYGHDVYFYDQIGGGLSHRLENIADYSLERHVADLKAVYSRIGATQVVLIGSSFGATLAAQYMAEFADDVSRAVFTAAGPMYLPDWQKGEDGTLDAVMSRNEKAAFEAAINKPRLIAAIILADINPEAAERFLPAREAGAFFDQIAETHYLRHIVCDPSDVDIAMQGFGFWSNRMTGISLRERTNDPKPQLRTNHTPVLILRGQCDYKAEAVARQYDDVFPNSRYEIHAGAGHMFYWDKPALFARTVGVFLQSPRE